MHTRNYTSLKYISQCASCANSTHDVRVLTAQYIAVRGEVSSTLDNNSQCSSF
jgi:hypothetical protein